MDEKQTLENFYSNCLTTCGEVRLKKIKWIMGTVREIIGKDLSKLNEDDVRNFLAYVNKSDFANWTKNDLKKIFKRFLKQTYKDNYIKIVEDNKYIKDGFKTLSARKCMNKEKISKENLVTPQELEALMRSANSLKWKAIISFLYESGFRPCELTVLKWKDLIFENSGICKVALKSSPKTGENRTVPVKDCVVHLMRWREEYQFPNRSENDYVFPSQHSPKEKMGHGVISEMFKRLCVEAKTRRIFPYLLRHSRICELQKRLPEKIVAKFAGHSVETSELYNHIIDDDVEETMLKQIYVTEEITPQEQNRIKKLEKTNQELKDKMDNIISVLGDLLNQKKGNDITHAVKGAVALGVLNSSKK